MSEQRAGLKQHDLSGRTAVVTGVCGKLGPIWADALLACGARVAGLDLPGARRPPAIEEVRARHDTERFQIFDADVTSRASLDRAVESIEERFGPVGILINNAGIDAPPAAPSRSYRLEDIPIEICDDIVRVNLLGLFQTTQAFLGSLRRAAAGKRGASIINIGSIYGVVSPDARLYDHVAVSPPFLKPPMYGASKAGVENLSRYFATHLAGDGIRVNTLIPGGVLGTQDADFRRKFCERVPLGRMATRDDLLGPLVFLASNASSYVTGQSLIVDGGLTCW
ncbi:MAG: SDR family oxidoreductase [Planctomycetota bacterium]